MAATELFQTIETTPEHLHTLIYSSVCGAQVGSQLSDYDCIWSSPVASDGAQDLRTKLDAAHDQIATLKQLLSAWATAAQHWKEHGGKIERQRLLELLDESILKDRAQTVERLQRDHRLALDLAQTAMASLGHAEQRLEEFQLAGGDRFDPVLLAALRAGRILREAADDAVWVLANIGGRAGRETARERLWDGLQASDHPDDYVHQEGNRRAALEALARAASNLRAAIAHHDIDSGVIWMFDGHYTVCERIDLLDQALDALAQSAEQPAAQLLDTALEVVLGQIRAAIIAGDVEKATIALTALAGEPLGTLVVRELRHLLHTNTTLKVAQ